MYSLPVVTLCLAKSTFCGQWDMNALICAASELSFKFCSLGALPPTSSRRTTCLDSGCFFFSTLVPGMRWYMDLSWSQLSWADSHTWPTVNLQPLSKSSNYWEFEVVCCSGKSWPIPEFEKSLTPKYLWDLTLKKNHAPRKMFNLTNSKTCLRSYIADILTSLLNSTLSLTLILSLHLNYAACSSGSACPLLLISFSLVYFFLLLKALITTQHTPQLTYL